MAATTSVVLVGSLALVACSDNGGDDVEQEMTPTPPGGYETPAVLPPPPPPTAAPSAPPAVAETPIATPRSTADAPPPATATSTPLTPTPTPTAPAEPEEQADYEIIDVVSKDVIQAIRDPDFLAVEEAESQYSPNEPVLGVSFNGEHRAYSIPYLSTREIVNDVVGGVAIAATW